jgi:hypothetical protein
VWYRYAPDVVEVPPVADIPESILNVMLELFTDTPFASVAETIIEPCWPTVVGVPLSKPELDKVIPVGNDPDAIAYVGATPESSLATS